MLRVNNHIIEIGHFPDGTQLIQSPSVSKDNDVVIEWRFENNEEMVALMFLARHYKDKNPTPRMALDMPYIPNARQDRVKHKGDVFTLKYFAEFINSLNFDLVRVLDPHSHVSEALFKNLKVSPPSGMINYVINEIYEETNNEELIAFFPDEGAMKRYSSQAALPYAFGVKMREWETGKIKGLSVIDNGIDIKGKNVIIIDDISSRGGTFYHSAKKLKELGANKIFLYVTHCEKTIFSGEIFKSGLIDKVFTTDSIFNDAAQQEAISLGIGHKIEVLAI